jgi:hypothetical protein
MRRSLYALAAYTVITLVMTWPLARGIARDVPWDLGDSILNIWILAWDGQQLRAILGGDVSRLQHFFDANIFYPAPLTLAYSDHLIAQAAAILPVYAATGNPILCYNLLFLSTFVLSGLGMYLLVRELTGSAIAGLVAGLLFAFAPYRIPQSSHLQVLSSQWMPFTLYGLRRYFETGRVRALAGASLALVAQNLSCGYYLLYFHPFVAAYVLWEIAQRRLWRHRTVWIRLSLAALGVAAATIPFILPYAELRAVLAASRSLPEVARYSADVYSYATASEGLTLWGAVAQAFPKPEGELFPGVVPLVLAAVGLIVGVVDAARARCTTPRRAAFDQLPFLRGSRWFVIALAAAVILHLAAALSVILLRRIILDLGWFEIRMTDATQLLLRAAIALAALLTVSPGARVRVAAFMRSRGFFLLALVAAVWLSLGPLPRALGRPLELAAPYRLLFDHVPGFDGLRVPARFAMIACLMLAVLGGYGAAALATRRIGCVVLASVAVAFLAEGASWPFLLNGMSPPEGFNAPEARLYPPSRAPAIYNVIARLPAEVVLAELPLGQPDFDLQAMYYSTVHWRKLSNGYSGFFPPHYGRLTVALTEVPRHPQISWDALRETGVTHVLVHEGAYLGNEGRATSTALQRLGAVELFRNRSDVLLALNP